MIRSISGTVVAQDPASAVVEVAGFGIRVFTPTPDAFAAGTKALFHTHLAVKQDGLELYGFSNTADLSFFELLLSVSGIGPKTALSILRRAPREQLETAIAARDLNYLTRVAGLGKKSAEKLAIEIGEKIGAGGKSFGDDAEVFDTLIALGYTEREARGAVSKIPKEVEGKEARLKAALSSGS